jgi:hypothetical protein
LIYFLLPSGDIMPLIQSALMDNVGMRGTVLNRVMATLKRRIPEDYFGLLPVAGSRWL